MPVNARTLRTLPPASSFGGELLRPPRAVEEVGEVERRDHAQRAIGAAPDQSFRVEDRRVEAVAVPHHQRHSGVARRLDHGAAFARGQRHRFFDQHVLAVRAGDARVRGMKLVWRGDIDDVHRGVGAELLY
jgi:hypothetical protein